MSKQWIFFTFLIWSINATASLDIFLADTIAKASSKNMTSNQKLVLQTLKAYEQNSVMCGLKLSAVLGNSASNISQLLSAAPAWLVEVSKKVFIDSASLTTHETELLEKHQFSADVGVYLNSNKTNITDSQVAGLLRRAILDFNPIERKNFSSGVLVTVSKISVDQSAGKNSLSCIMNLVYKNGETQELDLSNAPIGTLEPAQTLSQLMISVINHREILTSEVSLRRELNALRYNLMKLLRVAKPEYESRISSLVGEIEKSQKISWFSRNRSILGREFLVYLAAKQEVLRISQEQMNNQAQIMANTPVKQSKWSINKQSSALNQTTNTPQYFSRSSGVFPRGNFSSGYYYPSRAMIVDRYSYDTSIISTMGWIMDPSFMLTHPWFWGANDNSYMGTWLMFELMADRTRYHGNEPLFNQNNQPDPQVFDRQVDPIYTTNAQNPVVDPWNGNRVDESNIISAVQQDNGQIGWVNQTGTRIDTYGDSDNSSVDTRWRNTTGQDIGGRSTIDLSNTPDDSQRFNNGNDSGGWQTPPPSSSERESTIKSS